MSVENRIERLELALSRMAALLLPVLRGRIVTAGVIDEWYPERERYPVTEVTGQIVGVRNGHFLVRDGCNPPVEVLMEDVCVRD